MIGDKKLFWGQNDPVCTGRVKNRNGGCRSRICMENMLGNLYARSIIVELREKEETMKVRVQY